MHIEPEAPEQPDDVSCKSNQPVIKKQAYHMDVLKRAIIGSDVPAKAVKVNQAKFIKRNAAFLPVR